MDEYIVTALYCQLDDLLKQADIKRLVKNDRFRPGLLSVGELLTLVLFYHQTKFADFKAYWAALSALRPLFPGLICYERAVAWRQKLQPLLAHLLKRQFTRPGEIAIVDSTPLPVCKMIRQARNKVFGDQAAIGYSTIEDRFFGLKLTLIVAPDGRLIAYSLDAGNTDDRVPLRKDDVIYPLKESGVTLLADAGYVSKQLKQDLSSVGIELLAKPKKNMTPFTPEEQTLYRKRQRVETVFGLLKDSLYKLVASKARSVAGFISNVLGALLAYQCRKVAA